MMRLSVSNLAWPAELDAAVFARLAGLGVSGLEVAPTRIAGWDELTDAKLRDYRERAADHGLAISSLQAILFGRGELNLLGDAATFAALCDHIRRVAGMAATLGAAVLVFGAPRNRLRGRMPEEAAWALGCQRFAVLGDVAAAFGVVIGIEPVPEVYGADFLMTWSDVLSMVEGVASAGIRVHLDNACVFLGGGSIGEAVTAAHSMLGHFHAAQPQLGDFAEPLGNNTEAAAALCKSGYEGWVAIEMRESITHPIGSLETAVRFVQNTYFISRGAP